MSEEQEKAEFQSGCLLCGEELIYLPQEEPMVCENCGKTVMGNVRCRAGHYVCDRCHAAPTYAEITQYCLASDSKDPLQLAQALFSLPHVKLHGPEHHYLVPAALLTAAANAGSQIDLSAALQTARSRAQNVLGGFCGFYGACGAAIGCGIFVSVLLAATPLSKDEWGAANLATAAALTEIGACGGPRCCKRNCRLALTAAASFAKEALGIPLERSTAAIYCQESANKECKQELCPYYSQR